MEYGLSLALLILLYGVLHFFRKAAERRRELDRWSVAVPVHGDGVRRFVCVRLDDGSSGSYFRRVE